jgi:hypothetical protein
VSRARRCSTSTGKKTSEYIYRVTGPTTGPEALRNPDIIFFNYKTRTIGEVRGTMADEKNRPVRF